MFVTSASEVAGPGIPDLLLVVDDQLYGAPQVLFSQLGVPCQLNLRLDPELRLAVGRLNVDVHPLLLSRKEEEPERTVPKDRRTHSALPVPPSGTDIHSTHTCAGGQDVPRSPRNAPDPSANPLRRP